MDQELFTQLEAQTRLLTSTYALQKRDGNAPFRRPSCQGSLERGGGGGFSPSVDTSTVSDVIGVMVARELLCNHALQSDQCQWHRIAHVKHTLTMFLYLFMPSP